MISQVTGDALMVSVVPADVGKPTLKLEKCVVHNGSCYWENAVYETVKFNREQKSGKILERIYYFVVGTVCNVQVCIYILCFLSSNLDV